MIIRPAIGWRSALSLLGVVVLLATASGIEPLRKGAPTGRVAERIDQELDRVLAAEKAPTSPPADDGEFLRRAYLDLHGVVPKRDRVVAFLNDRDPDKRAKLIDELLEAPAYGRHFGMTWFNRMVPRAARARGFGDETVQTWLAEQFNANRGWDAIVVDVLTSEGAADVNPATAFFLATLNDDRDPQPSPDKAAAAVARLFLGLRLECCQCHNHPFNDLKQTDFWSTAAFFINLRAEQVPGTIGKRPLSVLALREGVMPTGVKYAKKVKPISTSAVIEIPESGGKTVGAKYLLGAELAPSEDPRYRPAFAEWLTAPSNRQFARAAVNRMWATLFGRGIIEPVDDMQPEHEPTHPELLDFLTDEFIASGYDLKHLIRAITTTRAYQRSSAPPEGSASESESYGHMAARVMTADQLYDSLIQILDHPVGEHIANGGQKRKYGDARERFRLYFHGGGDDFNTPVPAYGHGIPQVLRIMNSPMLTDGTKLLQALDPRGTLPPEKMIDGLYLTTLSRYPTADERRRVSVFLAEESDREKAYSDLLWVLLNGAEFLHNH